MLLQHLLTFCRVVEEGGITRAAEQLSLSQPTVTKQVAALEAEIGTRLLNRQGRQVRLTPAGRQVYASARRISHLVAEMRAGVEALTSPDQGLVRLSCVSTVGLFALPDVLAEYTHRYPAVRVHVSTGKIQEVVDQLLQEEADLGLVTTGVNHPRLEATPLFDDPVLVVASPRRAAELPRPMQLHHLGETAMIAYQEPSNFRAYVDGILEHCGVYPRTQMEFDTHEAVKTMVRLGLGIAMAPRSAVLDDLEAGRLVTVDVDGLPEMRRTTTLLLRHDRPHIPTVQRFAELVVERLQEPGGRAT